MHIDPAEGALCRIWAALHIFPCEMSSGFAGLHPQAHYSRRDTSGYSMCRGMWRIEEYAHLYSKMPPNPWAHSADKDFSVFKKASVLITIRLPHITI